MRTLNGRLGRVAFGLGLMGVLAASGCNQGPRGDTGGTIDPYNRTRVDANSPEADVVTLLEFSDQVGQELAVQLGRIGEIRNAPSKALIELGSIQNKTRTPSGDFAAIQRRVFLTLVNSDFAQNVADVVEDVDRMDADAARVAPSAPVDAQGKPTHQTARYPAEQTYFLQGTFSELSRGGGRNSTFVFDFTLTNAASRKIVFARQITPKQGY